MSLLQGVVFERLSPLQILSCFSWLLQGGKVSADFFVVIFFFFERYQIGHYAGVKKVPGHQVLWLTQ